MNTKALKGEIFDVDDEIAMLQHTLLQNGGDKSRTTYENTE
jgi:hypothetical protein